MVFLSREGTTGRRKSQPRPGVKVGDFLEASLRGAGDEKTIEALSPSVRSVNPEMRTGPTQSREVPAFHGFFDRYVSAAYTSFKVSLRRASVMRRPSTRTSAARGRELYWLLMAKP